MPVTKENDIVLEAKGELRKGGANYISIAFAFFLLCLISSALCLLSVAMGMLVASFLVMPFYFGFVSVASAYASSDVQPTNKITFRQFGSYFTRPFVGCFRVMLNLLKSIGSFALGMVLCLLVYGLIAGAVDPAFQTDYAAFASAYAAGDAEGAANVLNNSLPLLRYVNVCVGVGTGMGFLTFYLWTIAYSLCPYVCFILAEAPTPFIRYYYGRYFSFARKEYWGLMVKHTYGMPFVVPLSYFLGMGVSFLFTADYGVAASIGFGLASLAMAAYLPLFGVLSNAFFSKRKRLFYLTQVEVSREMVSRAENSPDLPSEQLEDIRKSLHDAEENLARYDEEGGEK